MADHALGLLTRSLGDRREARTLLESAICSYRTTGANAWLAVCLADLAETADDVKDALTAATEAAAVAEDIGAPNVAQRASSALQDR